MPLLSMLRRLFGRPGARTLDIDPSLAAAVDLLTNENLISSTTQRVQRYAVSEGGRFCALTLETYESFVVDLQSNRYMALPNSGVSGFVGNNLVLSPDDERFSLEPTYTSYEMDLASEIVEWKSAGPVTAGAIHRDSP